MLESSLTTLTEIELATPWLISEVLGYRMRRVEAVLSALWIAEGWGLSFESIELSISQIEYFVIGFEVVALARIRTKSQNVNGVHIMFYSKQW